MLGGNGRKAKSSFGSGSLSNLWAGWDSDRLYFVSFYWFFGNTWGTPRFGGDVEWQLFSKTE